MTTTYNAVKKEAVTTFEMGEAQETGGKRMGQRRLTISTYKYDKDMITAAQVAVHYADGSYSCVLSFGAGDGDFTKRLQRTTGLRATEKTILAAHAAVAEKFTETLAAAQAHYA